jgi:glycosyltransferase involved in cell wall biosynthesis
MRIHIISDVYPPEPLTAAVAASDIAAEMTRRGHDTTVFAPFPNRPAGTLFRGYHRAWTKTEDRDGYRIIHSWHTLSKRSTLLSRLAENVSFGITSTFQLIGQPAPDVIYMNTWPIFAQWMNTFVLYQRRVPVICVVHDLYPETFPQGGWLGRLTPLMVLIRSIDKCVYRQSTIVTALNSTQEEYLVNNRGVPAGKVRVFHDWTDASRFPPCLAQNGSFRIKHSLSQDLFLAMYVGSITRMAGLELYVKAAERLRHRKDIQIVLVGDGAVRGAIEAAIQQRGVANIRMIYPLEREEVPWIHAAADALLLSLLPGAAEHTTPSKLIFYMFSGRAVLASVKDDSPVARIVREANCGYVIRQGDAEDLARRLEKMADDRLLLQSLGQNARVYAEENFSKTNVLPRVCDMIEEVGRRQ